ncbi:vWA domain-containing protein [Luteolibacter marinus]|uniref:vWA domain-containing protein n=1 Tax=Luteolibacter marinus TaxID=2776705 RepID=UPI001D014636|nr:VWA domain-containing protein [Luteolibacter marinus]
MNRLVPIFSLFASAMAVAAPITRTELTAIPVGPVSYNNTSLRGVLLEAKKIAAGHDIQLSADAPAQQIADEERLSLDAEGLTLDGLLELAIQGNGLEWKIEGRQILFYSEPKKRVEHRRRLQSKACQKLGEIIVPEIIFENASIPEAFELVREQAIKIAGIGSVPKVDASFVPSVPKTVSLKVRKASVLNLFDLLTAVSASSVAWDLDGSKILVFDEAKRREDLRRRKSAALARRRQGSGGDDPFSAPDAGARIRVPGPEIQQRPRAALETESYDYFGDNPFFSPQQKPLSTFSIDVDTASYSNVRRMIKSGSRVPVDATRIEEFLNYFTYDYAPPATGEAGKPVEGPPFSANIEAASTPWAPAHRLVRIGLKGYENDWETRPPSNLVFLLDVSGSMGSDNKLPLVKESLRLLVRRLDERDRISIVVYAGNSGLVLPPTPANKRKKILRAIDQLEAGGSTNGGEGISLAYKTAREHFNQLGNNRVILCTDGDFNVGTTDQSALVKRVEEQGRTGVYLTVLGFGMGNLKDDMLEILSNKGNGNYAYVDSREEARKVFVQGVSGTLVTIAKDVKIQVEFNPAKVGAYRLIGYENRLLEAQDFDDDTKDAGEIGAGHSVTAFYEVIPAGMEAGMLKRISPLKYQKVEPRAETPGAGDELFTLKLRYKEPEAGKSRLMTIPFTDAGGGFADASVDFRFASSVASFGMILRDSDFRGDATLPAVIEMAAGALGEDRDGYRKEFLELVETYSRGDR